MEVARIGFLNLNVVPYAGAAGFEASTNPTTSSISAASKPRFFVAAAETTSTGNTCAIGDARICDGRTTITTAAPGAIYFVPIFPEVGSAETDGADPVAAVPGG